MEILSQPDFWSALFAIILIDLALVWIARKLASDDGVEGPDVAAKATLRGAVWTIVGRNAISAPRSVTGHCRCWVAARCHNARVAEPAPNPP